MQENELTLADVLAGIWKRKFQIALVAGLVTVLVGVVTVMTPRRYHSDAAVFIRLGAENTRLDATTTLGASPSLAVPLNRDVEINSIASLIESRDMLGQLVEHFGPETIINEGLSGGQDSPGWVGREVATLKQTLTDWGLRTEVSPREEALMLLEENLTTRPMPDTTLIHIDYVSKDPMFSQQVLDELLRRYVDYHVRIHRPQEGPQFLEEQLADVSRALTAQEQELDELRLRAGLYSASDQRRLLAERISTVEQQLADARADRDSHQAEVEALQQRLESIPETTSLSSTTGAGNLGVDGMRQQLYQLQIEYERVLAEKTKDHPLAVRLKQQLDKSDEILKQVEAGRTETVSGPNPVHEDLRTDLVRRQSQTAADESRIAALHDSLSELQAQSQAFVRAERQHQRLSREIEVNDATYRSYSDSLQQARIDQALKSHRLSNLSIAQAATFREAPVSPNVKLNLALGLVLGLVLGCSLAVLRECFLKQPAAGATPAAATLPVVGDIPTLQVARETPATVNS